MLSTNIIFLTLLCVVFAVLFVLIVYTLLWRLYYYQNNQSKLFTKYLINDKDIKNLTLINNYNKDAGKILEEVKVFNNQTNENITLITENLKYQKIHLQKFRLWSFFKKYNKNRTLERQFKEKNCELLKKIEDISENDKNNNDLLWKVKALLEELLFYFNDKAIIMQPSIRIIKKLLDHISGIIGTQKVFIEKGEFKKVEENFKTIFNNMEYAAFFISRAPWIFLFLKKDAQLYLSFTKSGYKKFVGASTINMARLTYTYHEYLSDLQNKIGKSLEKGDIKAAITDLDVFHKGFIKLLKIVFEVKAIHEIYQKLDVLAQISTKCKKRLIQQQNTLTKLFQNDKQYDAVITSDLATLESTSKNLNDIVSLLKNKNYKPISKVEEIKDYKSIYLMKINEFHTSMNLFCDCDRSLSIHLQKLLIIKPNLNYKLENLFYKLLNIQVFLDKKDNEHNTKIFLKDFNTLVENYKSVRENFSKSNSVNKNLTLYGETCEIMSKLIILAKNIKFEEMAY